MRILVFTALLATLLLFATRDVQAQEKIWSFCSGEKQDPSWLIQVDSVTFEPKAPKIGAQFKVHVKGDLKETIEGDAFVDLDVAYSGVQLFKGQQKVCAPGFLSCPIKAGKLDQTIVQDVPAFAPPGGPYTGTARLVDSKGRTFTCIQFNFNMDTASAEKVSYLEEDNLDLLSKKIAFELDKRRKPKRRHHHRKGWSINPKHFRVGGVFLEPRRKRGRRMDKPQFEDRLYTMVQPQKNPFTKFMKRTRFGETKSFVPSGGMRPRMRRG